MEFSRSAKAILPFLLLSGACAVEGGGGDSPTATPSPSLAEGTPTATQTAEFTPSLTLTPSLSPDNSTPTPIPISPTPTPGGVDTPTPTPTPVPTPKTLRAAAESEWVWESIDMSALIQALPVGAHDLLLADEDGELHYFDGGLGFTMPWPALPAAPSAAADYDGITTLWIADGVLYGVDDSAINRSPITDIMPGHLQNLVRGAGTALWFSSDRALGYWNGGEFWSLTPGSLPTDEAQLAWAKGGDGQDVLWVLSHARLYELRPDGPGWSALEHLMPSPAVELAASAAGGIWIRLENGELAQFEADLDDWRHFKTEKALSGLRGGAEDGLWMALADGGLWKMSERAEMPEILHITGDEIHLEAVPLGYDQICVSQNGAPFRLSASRAGYFTGFVEGEKISERREIQLMPTWDLPITQVEFRVDGQGETLLEPPFTTELDPALLDDGLHEIEGQVHYDDGDVVVTAMAFTVGDYQPPTWDDDIERIYLASCANGCHDISGGARPLYTPEQWEAEIEAILSALKGGLMPLGAERLDDGQIAEIEAWKATGFTR